MSTTIKKFLLLNWLLIIYLIPSFTQALTFTIDKDSDIVGSIQVTEVRHNESFGDIGRRFDMGVYDIIEANPSFDPWYPRVGAKVVIPSKFILPAGDRKGIVINLAEMRLYYYHPNTNLVSTYPIGIGKKGWLTPLGNTKIINKQKNPTWYPPKSIRDEHIKNNDPLPKIVPPGPNNPLGKHALRLAMPGYLIHGTNRKGGIGVRSSSGCIRLFPQDIKDLYEHIKIGTPVRIIHKPFKIGKHNENWYIEVHQPLSDNYYTPEDDYKNFIATLKRKLGEEIVNLPNTDNTLDRAYGYPVILVPNHNIPDLIKTGKIQF